MGARAYLLVDVKENVSQEEFVQIIRELEDMVEVDFADPVVGNCDIVVMIEAADTVQAVAQKLSKRLWVKNIQILKIFSIFERHRSSKKLLLQLSQQEGVKA